MAIRCLVCERATSGAEKIALGGELMTYTSQQQKYLDVGLAACRYLKHLLTLVLQWTRLSPEESLNSTAKGQWKMTVTMLLNDRGEGGSRAPRRTSRTCKPLHEGILSGG